MSRIRKIKCPHCETVFETSKVWAECQVCGNDYPTKPYEIDEDLPTRPEVSG